MAKTNKQNKIALPIMLLILQLFFLYYVKYQNQSVGFNSFSLLKIGNFINFITYSVIVAGLIYVVKKKSALISNKIKTTLFIISWVLLLFAFISTRIKIISEKVYFLNQPGDKVLTGVIFLLYLISLLYLMVYLGSIIFSKQKPKIVKMFFNIFLILFTFFILIIIYSDNTGYASGRWAIQKNHKNIAVVLGAAVWSGNIPSPTLASRVDKAMELLGEGFAGRIVLTGGKAPGELPESEVAFEYAKVKGVDTSLIIIESYTSSTSDQIKWVKNNLSNGRTQAEIILISDAYHLPRVIEISKFFNLDIKVAESTHKMDFNDLLYNKIRESIALFNFWNFAL